MVLSTRDHKAYLAIDAGGTYIKSALLNVEGIVYEGSAFVVKSYSASSQEKILDAIRETIMHGVEYLRNQNIALQGIGFAIPGPFDYCKGIPLMKHKFKNIYGVNLREIISEIPGIFPDVQVTFIHDANAVLEGELWQGNAAEFPNSAVVTLGTGLGFAISENKVIQCNSQGGPLVTIFKLPYKSGILEDYVSKRGILRIYYEITGIVDIGSLKVSDLGKKADEGDAYCIQAFQIAGKILAESLHDILQERNIQCLLFGGQISHSFHHMEVPIRQELKDINGLSKISVVKSIANAALLGALNSTLKGSNNPIKIELSNLM